MNQIDYTTDPELDYLNEDLCDVVFEVEGQRIPVPKIPLVYRSRVFRAMFSGKHEGSEDKVIPIEDTTVEAFKTFIRSIICDQWVAPKTREDNDFQLIGQLYRLSDRYEVCRLSDKIMDFIKPFVGSHLRSMARIAFNYQMDPLMAIIKEYIEMNINQIINKNIEELSEINDCTNDLLFDALFSGRVSSGYSFNVEGKRIYIETSVIPNKRMNEWNSYELLRYTTIEDSFEAFKVFIGFLYFNRLIIKDKNDIQLIHEVCEMAERYSFKDLKNAISADLKDRITLNNVKPIFDIIYEIDIKDLREKVFEFIRINAEELLKRDVQLIREISIINRKYPAEELLTAISSVIKNILTFDNLRPILIIIKFYNFKDIMEKVFEFIETNIKELVTKDVEELKSKKNEGLKLIRRIFDVINKYKVYVDLKERITPLLCDCLTFDNLVIIYKFAVQFKVEDLITNIETFIIQNRRQLSGKDMTELNEMNNEMNGKLFEVMAKHLIND